jgi:hypothetical protein
MFRAGPLLMCVRIYNKLPNNIKDEERTDNFKILLKQYLIKKCFYSLQEFLSEY